MASRFKMSRCNFLFWYTLVKECCITVILLQCIVIFTCQMCDYNVKSVQGNQLNKDSGEKLSKDHGIIIVNCLQEMLLRKGSKNIWTEFSVDWIEKETLQKYLIQNCRHSIETNTTHNYCQETFLAWLLKSFDSYSMGHMICRISYGWVM